MKRFVLELKIAGINFFLVTAAVSLALLIFAAVAGPLLDFAPIAFEVLLPFYAAIAVGEWGRTRADSSFEAIAAQSRSRFFWTLCRSASVLTVVSLFAVTTMALAVLIRRELPFPTLLALYFPTAFFFSSLAVLVAAGAHGDAGVRAFLADRAAHPQPAAAARRGICVPVSLFCRRCARRVAVEQSHTNGNGRRIMDRCVGILQKKVDVFAAADCGSVVRINCSP